MKEFLVKPNLHTDQYNNYQLGKYISTDIDEISAKSIVILTVDSFYGRNKEMNTSFQRFRQELYDLTPSKWKLPMFDIGTLAEGHSQEDTFFALDKIIKYCLEKQAYPVLIGGSQYLIYSLFQSLKSLKKPIHYTAIDYTIPLEPDPNDELQDSNLLNHLLADDNQMLFQFSNIGYQSYYTSYQIIDTLHSLDFEAIRLGEITADLKESEPVFRSTDLASLNLDAVESFQSHDRLTSLPNGFNSREICAITKFAGISNQLKLFGIFNYIENSGNVLLSKLLAQIVWYYIEGKNASLSLENTQKKYLKFRVMHEDKEIIFYKDEPINKWWIVLENEPESQNIMIPCSEKDYEKAKNNEIPDRYWKNLKRFL